MSNIFLGGRSPAFIFNMVKGAKVHGLLVDPGASRALIGMDTLRDIIKNVLRPQGLHRCIAWHKSANYFSGISATKEYSMGIVRFPIGLFGIKTAYFCCDVIGGGSSTCSGLIPLRALSVQKAVCSHVTTSTMVMACWEYALVEDTTHHLLLNAYS